MDQKSSQIGDFNSLSLLEFVYRWRKQLIIIGGIACVISSIISLTITEKYQSTVVLFPGVTYSASKALIADNLYRPDVIEFGDEEKAEQMLQILNSNEVRDKICAKYHLMAHYDIDSTSELSKTALYNEFESNVTFQRTKYMSVRIDVLDKDPIIASNIANDIAEMHDSARFSIQKQRADVAYEIIKQEYESKTREVKALEDSLTVINKLGVLDLESQSEVITEEYAKAVARNDQRAVNALQEKLDILGKYGSAFLSLTEHATSNRIQLNALKNKLIEARLDLEETLPQKFIVSAAEPAEKKAYPIRWIIVVVTTFSTLFLTIIFLLFFENIKGIKTN